LAEKIGKAKKVRSVAVVRGKTQGHERVRPIEVIWGDTNTTTLHREWGCLLKVDPSKVFFTPRLSYERMRVAKLVRGGETILNAFAGVGAFSILISKLHPSTKIISVDSNPYAFEFMLENRRLNKCWGVVPVLSDALDVLKSFSDRFDRVLLPLPELSLKALPYAVRCVKNGGVIHFYGTACRKRGLPQPSDLWHDIKEAAEVGGEVGMKILNFRKVRAVNRGIYHVVYDLLVQKRHQNDIK
jgi:tRNA (guanine37-N1)-methyltransferase